MFSILLILAAILVGFLIYVSTRPDTFRLERGVSIVAPIESIHRQIANFHAWQSWSPWEGLDPDLKRIYSGPDSGTGAVYSWSGNRKAGSGTMTILEDESPEKVVIRLDFTAPFKAQNTAEFVLTKDTDDHTRVTWAMHGPSPFIGKLVGVVLDMDALLGKNFDDGLAKLKTLCESEFRQN